VPSPPPPRLPRIASAAALLHGGPAEGPEGPLAALVLAEQPAVRHRWVEALRKAGHSAAGVAQPTEALDRLHREPCDVLLILFRPPMPAPLLALARALRGLPPPLRRVAMVGLPTQAPSPMQAQDCLRAGIDTVLPDPASATPEEAVLAALGSAVAMRWGPGPLNADVRAALAATVPPEEMAARDVAAVDLAGRLAVGLRETREIPALREGAERIAEALAPIGALAAPAAARALAAAPHRRNVLLPPLLSALVALRTALRRKDQGRAERGQAGTRAADRG
jgi:CheY-like chemotaxis protein